MADRKSFLIHVFKLSQMSIKQEFIVVYNSVVEEREVSIELSDLPRHIEYIHLCGTTRIYRIADYYLTIFEIYQ